MVKIDTAQTGRTRIFTRFSARQTSELGSNMRSRLSGYEVSAKGL